MSHGHGLGHMQHEVIVKAPAVIPQDEEHIPAKEVYLEANQVWAAAPPVRAIPTLSKPRQEVSRSNDRRENSAPSS